MLQYKYYLIISDIGMENSVCAYVITLLVYKSTVAFDLWFTYHLPCYVCRMKLIYSVWGQLQQGEGIFQKPKYGNVFIVFKNDLLPHWRCEQGQESFEFHSHAIVMVVTSFCSRSRICVGIQNFFYVCRAAWIHRQFRSRWHQYVCLQHVFLLIC